MGEADLQRGMALEHAAEHETCGRDGGVERVADQIAEIIGRQAIRARPIDGVEEGERLELGGRGANRAGLGTGGVSSPPRSSRSAPRAGPARAPHDEARPRLVSAPAWAASRWRESGRGEPWPAWQAARSECGQTPPPAPAVAHRRTAAGKPRAPERRPLMPPCLAGGGSKARPPAGKGARRLPRLPGWRTGPP